jgi:uncharacterized protein HemY
VKFLEELQRMLWLVLWLVLFYATIWFGVIIMLHHCDQAVSGKFDTLYTGTPTILAFVIALVTTLWWMCRGSRFERSK